MIWLGGDFVGWEDVQSWLALWVVFVLLMGGGLGRKREFLRREREGVFRFGCRQMRILKEYLILFISRENFLGLKTKQTTPPLPKRIHHQRAHE